MKVWIETLHRKSGNKLAVKVMINGKKKQRALFEKNQKRQAKEYAASLRLKEPHLAMPADITFATAIKEYSKTVLSNELLAHETRLHMVAHLNHHIAPHISKEALTDYTYHDFKTTYIPALINSYGMRVKNAPGGKTTVERTNIKLGKKSIKDAVANFKLFVKYCLERKWVIDSAILEFKFNKNFFQGENTKAKWMPRYQDVIKLVTKQTDPLNKALFHTAAETGMRLNEILGLTYSDIDLKSKPALIYLNHSTDKWNNFRENFLKTSSSKRRLEISNSLALILDSWMKAQTPKRAGQYRLVFGTVSKKMARRRIMKAADRLGIKWESGLSPLRKFSQSYAMDQKIFTEAQLDGRFGNSAKVRQKHYYKDFDVNKEERVSAINKMLPN